MTPKKSIERAAPVLANDSFASRELFMLQQMAMALEPAYLGAARDLVGPSALSLAGAQIDSSILRMVADLGFCQHSPDLTHLSRYSEFAESALGLSGRTAIANSHRSALWPIELAHLDTHSALSIAREHSELQRAIEGISNQLTASSTALDLARSNLSASTRSAFETISALDLTAKRFAALAGVTEIFGLGELHRQSAQSLLGQWHTSLALPQVYWEDIYYRRQLYREAEVDEGLIEADLETTIEVGISSGAIVGEIIQEGRYVVGQSASGLLTLTSESIASDIFDLVGTIETALRQHITKKLIAIAGTKWFKQRVPSQLLVQATETRKRALKAGEPPSPLIEYLTLGELLQIVLRKDNWDQVFEPVFRNRDWFKRDIEVIVIARNPNVHYRANDSLRLVEAIVVWQRLCSYINDDGQWREDARSEV